MALLSHSNYYTNDQLVLGVFFFITQHCTLEAGAGYTATNSGVQRYSVRRFSVCKFEKLTMSYLEVGGGGRERERES